MADHFEVGAGRGAAALDDARVEIGTQYAPRGPDAFRHPARHAATATADLETAPAGREPVLSSTRRVVASNSRASTSMRVPAFSLALSSR